MFASSALCRPCLEMVSAEKPSATAPEWFPHHSSVKALFQAVDAGCPICRILTTYYLDFLDDAKLIPRNPKRHREELSMEFAFSFDALRFRVFDNKLQVPDHLANIAVVPVKDEGDQPQSLNFAPNTHSEQSWQVAFNWIRRCVASHPGCKKGNPNFIPTRLLYLGTSSEPMLRLHVTKHALGKLPPYMSLSHCWGKIQIKRLLTANLDLMCEGIKVDELPKTFQDAIQFTRAFGVSYLWIDSLCIIQDSVADWEKESATMGDVYKNALCNIAATAAPDGSFGCFFERDPSLLPICTLHSKEMAVRNREEYEIFKLFPKYFLQDVVDEAPLNQRAWVMQERSLSPRTVHCGRTQLFWECDELLANESFESGFPQLPQVEQKSDARYVLGKDLSKNDALSIWDDLIGAYSRRSLTKDRDRLVAISAIAKEFGASIKSEYLAGLWRFALISQLLWYVWVPEERGATRRTDTYCAPTWSWASLMGHTLPTTYRQEDIDSSLIKILACEVKLATSDLYGQVSSGFLKVEGWLRSLKPFEFPNDKFHEVSPQKWEIELQWGITGEIYADTTEKLNPHELYFLPVLEVYGEHAGLVLVKTAVEGQYQRVGRVNENRYLPFGVDPALNLLTPPKSNFTRRLRHLRVGKRQDPEDGWVQTTLTIV